MKKQKKSTSAPTIVDAKPTGEPSKVPIEINGNNYNLCFDFGELAKAERFYQMQGHQFHLILALSQFTLESLQVVFPCAVRTHHPELTWAHAQELVTLQSSTSIGLAVAGAIMGARQAS